MEHWQMIGLIMVVVMITFILTGTWMFLALTASALLLLHFLAGGLSSLSAMAQYNIVDTFTLTAIPLFIFMGNLLRVSDILTDVYSALAPLLKRFPGQLLQTNIGACAVFGACSGSSLAGCATLGAIAIPELKERGYDRKLTYGSLAAGGTLASIIPPSICFIVYGGLTGVSVGQLFIAGIIPGLMMVFSFMGYIAVVTKLNPSVVPPADVIESKSLKESLKILFPPLLIVLAVMGSIYMGIATATEAAATGGMVVFFLILALGRMKWTILKEAALETVRTTCMLMILIAATQIFAMVLSMVGITQEIINWVTSQNLSAYLIWFAIAIMYIITSCFVTGTALMLLTLPLLFPLLTTIGFDPVWYGVMQALLLDLGAITPPIGMSLFIIHGLSGEKSWRNITLGVIPFIIMELIILVIITFIPELATWLPGTMYKPY